MLLILPLSLFSQAQFLEVVTKKDMEAARKKASDGMQLLFVDIYATWCGPCKKMDSEVYTNPELGAYMNEHFVNVRMDGETDYGRNIVNDLELKGYPSIFVFGSEGDLITSIVGFKPAGELLTTLIALKGSYAQLKRYRSLNAEGTLDKSGLVEYIDLLKVMGNDKEAANMAVKYSRMDPEGELTEEDLRVIAPYMDLVNESWSVLRENTALLKQTFGADYASILQVIYNNTLSLALEEQNIELVSRMSHELMPLLEDAMQADRDMRSMPFIHFYYFTNRHKELISYIDDRFEADKKGDYRWLYGAASQIVDMDQRSRTPELMGKAEEWFAACIAIDKQFDYYFYYGLTLLFQDRTKEAKASLDKASELVETDEQQNMIKQVMQYIGQ